MMFESEKLAQGNSRASRDVSVASVMDMQWCNIRSGNDFGPTWDMSESQSKHTELGVTYRDEQ
jgi:hypothetical protein